MHKLANRIAIVAMVIAVISVISVISGGSVASAEAASVRTFKNCTQLNAVYKHGVGKVGAHDKTSGRPVTNFTVNTALYNANKKSDRDKDGIACEKK